MTNAIGDLLPKKRFEEPPEVRLIKAFVQDNFQQPVTVTIKPTQIILQVKSAALAGALRMRLHELQSTVQTDKRLTIRIG